MEEQQLPYNPNTATPPAVAGPAIKMALIIAGIMIVYTLVLYIANQGTNKVLGYVNYVFVFGGLILATVNYREKQLGGFITYGKAFYFGFMVSLFVSLIYGIYYYIHFKFIAHDLIGQIMQTTQEGLVKRGLPDDQIQQAMNMTKKFMVPGAMAIIGFILTLIFSTILSLISAAIAKKDPPIIFPQAS